MCKNRLSLFTEFYTHTQDFCLSPIPMLFVILFIDYAEAAYMQT